MHINKYIDIDLDLDFILFVFIFLYPLYFILFRLLGSISGYYSTVSVHFY